MGDGDGWRQNVAVTSSLIFATALIFFTWYNCCFISPDVGVSPLHVSQKSNSVPGQLPAYTDDRYKVSMYTIS